MKEGIGGYFTMIIPNVQMSQEVMKRIDRFQKVLGSAADVTKQVVFTFAEDYLMVMIRKKFYRKKYEEI